ncbi:hypothetical protein [Paraclostridium dentum]|uniref:hypothetical protein n=1 Tax=Paraclostridium dentum TaxID=2662455 RepID=UPI003F3BB974
MLENKASLFNKTKDESGRVNVSGDFGVVNSESKSSVLTKRDGNTTVAAGEYTQFKLDKQGNTITQKTLKSVDVSVEKEIVVKDININHHKFNNQFIELTDFRQVNDEVIGGMMINGTVLVKTYEPNLEK